MATTNPTTTAASTDTPNTATDNTTDNDANTTVCSGSIIVVAKCPVAGQSKTRLIPLLGVAGSAQLAKAMLADVLTALGRCKELETVEKILLYAPPTAEGAAIMTALLQELGLLNTTNNESTTKQQPFQLRPMTGSPELRASHLGDALTHALVETRHQQQPQTVVFLGMDSPELPLAEIVYALRTPSTSSAAAATPTVSHLCPAADGGYGMLAVSGSVPAEAVFAGVRWSDPLTALSQIKALTDANGAGAVTIGRLMHDVDEPDDVYALCQRLLLVKTVPTDDHDCLLALSTGASQLSSTTTTTQPQSCPFTRQALIQLQQLLTE